MIEDLLILAGIAGISAGLHKMDQAADRAKNLRERHRHGKLRVVALAAVFSCHPVTVKTIEGYALHMIEVIVVRH